MATLVIKPDQEAWIVTGTTSSVDGLDAIMLFPLTQKAARALLGRLQVVRDDPDLQHEARLSPAFFTFARSGETNDDVMVFNLPEEVEDWCDDARHETGRSVEPITWLVPAGQLVPDVTLANLSLDLEAVQIWDGMISLRGDIGDSGEDWIESCPIDVSVIQQIADGRFDNTPIPTS